MKMSVGTLCLALQFSVVTAQMSWTASLLQTIDDLLGSGTKNGDVSTEETVEAVDVLWGVTDREATVGKLFKMTIPNNAFSGNVQSYMVTQPGRTALPRWIYHNTTTNVLYGVPSMVDLGNVLLEVTAYGPEHTTSNKSKNKLTPHASTSFVISVHPDTLKHPTWHNHLTADSNEDLDETFFSQQEGMCNWNENIVRASLVLDASMEELKPESRVMLLYKAANFLQKSVQAFRLTEKHSRVITRLMDTSVLLAGPGNADIRTTNVGIELSWIISCGDSSNVDDISKILSHTIQTGRISRELGYDIISWHLTETMPPENIRRIRKKRQAQLHTPINTPTLYPTATSTTRSSTSASTSSSTSTSTMSLTGTLTSSLASTSASTSASESIHMSSTIQITSSEVTIEPSVTLTSLPLTSTSLPSLMPSTFLSSIESTLVTSSMISLAVTSEPGTFSPTPVLTTTTLLETVAALELSSVSGSSSEFMTETSPSGFLMPESSSVASLSLSPLSSTEPSLTSSVFFLQTSSNPSQSVAMVTSSVNSEETTLVPPGSVSSSLEVSAANHPPQLVNPMKKIAVHLGTFFKVDVPYDTFYDFEDGNTRSLKLSLRTTGGDYIGPGSFIQLNSERQVLYGLALEQHVTDGTVVLELVAEDQYGETAVDNIEVIINSANVQDVSFVIKTTFDLDYASFTSRIVNVITLMYRISAFYGDESPMFYTVISISNGSVIVEWTDNRISRASCQNDAISHVYGTIYSEGKINPAFKEMLLPEFPLKYLTYKLVGACLRTEVTPTDMISTEAIVAAATGRSIALLIILPMIIILIVIMVIFLIYWFCLRNRQKHTDYLTDQERQIYANNRKPVLLESELEMNDVQQKPRKPLILNEEAPSKAFDNPGYIDLDEGRPLPPPYALPQEEPMAAIYGPVQATSTPKAPYNEDTLSDRPPPPPYRVPPIYLGTPGSSNI